MTLFPWQPGMKRVSSWRSTISLIPRENSDATVGSWAGFRALMRFSEKLESGVLVSCSDLEKGLSSTLAGDDSSEREDCKIFLAVCSADWERPSSPSDEDSAIKFEPSKFVQSRPMFSVLKR
jgi:hypothetical protein